MCILAVTAVVCKHSVGKDKTEPKPSKMPIEAMGCCDSEESLGLFDRPINIGEKDKINMAKLIYADTSEYSVVQDTNQRFKDHAPFIEIISEDSTQERLWFSSSRYPQQGDARVKLTDKVMQIYYIDRTVSESGCCPNELWENQTLRMMKTGDSQFDGYTKGAVTIAQNRMICTADQPHTVDYRNEYLSLWELKKDKPQSRSPYIDPKPIEELSNDKTWESQPTLSKDGLHIFFVSNRFVDNYKKSDSYVDTTTCNNTNIYYSHRNDLNSRWNKPILVTEISTGENNEETPHLGQAGLYLYYSSDKGGNFDFYKRQITLSDSGYKLNKKETEVALTKDNGDIEREINTTSDERYIFEYNNPKNKNSLALIWSSNRIEGWGNYDIYGCAQQMLKPLMRVFFIDASKMKIITTEEPIAELFEDSGTSIKEGEIKPGKTYVEFKLDLNKSYFVKGGTQVFNPVENLDLKNSYINKWYEADYEVDNRLAIHSWKDQGSKVEKKLNRWELAKYKRNQSKEFQSKEDTTMFGLELKRKKIINTTEIYSFSNIVYDNQMKVATGDLNTQMTNEVEILGFYRVLTDNNAKAVGGESSPKILGPSILASGSRNKYFTTPKKITKETIYRDTVYLVPQISTVEINYEVVLIDKCNLKPIKIQYPIIEMKGDKSIKVQKTSLTTKLESEKTYYVKGGVEQNDFDDCSTNDSLIWRGYVGWKRGISECDLTGVGKYLGVGANWNSINTTINTAGIYTDTTIYDTIYISKLWDRKPPCPMARVIVHGKYKNEAYFQTAFWEVNTSKNLKRHMTELQKGFKIKQNSKGDIEIERELSDYVAKRQGRTMYEVKKGNSQKYSIANARWIELHPYNMYWGQRYDWCLKSNMHKRLQNREYRIGVKSKNPATIPDYSTYAAHVDDNLQYMADMATGYIDVVETIRDRGYGEQPKLLITARAVSDQRGVTRGWYIGDTVRYRRTVYDSTKKTFKTKWVEIDPPTVDENNKIVSGITKHQKVDIINRSGKMDTLRGNHLGQDNVVLSRLRAWYGYKELYNLMIKNPKFKKYLDEGRVALPDNDVSYEKADIIVVTHGIEIPTGHEKWGKTEQYPKYNNPGKEGYFGYDKVRRVEMVINIIEFYKSIVVQSECCNREHGLQVQRVDEVDLADKESVKRFINTNEDSIKAELNKTVQEGRVPTNNVNQGSMEEVSQIYYLNFGFYKTIDHFKKMKVEIMKISNFIVESGKFEVVEYYEDDSIVPTSFELKYRVKSTDLPKFEKALENAGITNYVIEK